MDMILNLLLLVVSAAAQTLNGHINPLWLSGSSSGLGPSRLNPASGLLYLDDSGRLKPVFSTSRLLLVNQPRDSTNNFRMNDAVYRNDFRMNNRNGYTSDYRTNYNDLVDPEVYQTTNQGQVPLVQPPLPLVK